MNNIKAYDLINAQTNYTITIDYDDCKTRHFLCYEFSTEFFFLRANTVIIGRYS